MTDLRIAKFPDLSFLKVLPNEPYNYPYFLDSNGRFDWEANLYLLEYSGGNLLYGVKPVPSTIIAHAQSISILLNFIEKSENLSLLSFSDENFYDYVSHLKKRIIDNGTIKTHCRKAIDYFLHLQKNDTDLKLITETATNSKQYQIHVIKRISKAGGKSKSYYDHKSFEGLVKITEEVDYIRDDEFIDWLDAINHTKEHPSPSLIIKLRWEAISYLLDATGSRISELKEITRSIIKAAYNPLADLDDEVQISNIPVKKGKYKGKSRTIPVSNGTIQLLMSYINEIEALWPNMDHDKLFVNMKNGKPLTGNYLKNYTLSVIKKSKYEARLRHVNNHSFRHRYITLNVAKKIKEYGSAGPITNLLPLALSAVRKLTLHASPDTMNTYVHLAQDYNNRYRLKNEHAMLSSLLKIDLKKLKRIKKQYESGKLTKQIAFSNMLEIINNL